jgi:hypothetical protein
MPRPVARFIRCSECGSALAGKKSRFCSPAHKDAWNNRQKRRGVQLLNLYAETRKNRAGRHGLTSVNRLMATWFAEDAAAGRVTYHPELIPPIVKMTL